MAASLTTAPASRSFSDNEIWITVTTDTPISSAASVVLTITSTGPTSGQQLTIAWAGNSITFTVSASDTENATDLPVKGAETLAEYADLFAERLAQNETLHRYFRISRASGELITLTQRTLEVVDITVTENLTNVAVSATDVTAITASESLRALVEVWADTGSLDTDMRLISLHAPYRLPAGTVDIDIHAAFSHISPHLPTEASINPLVTTALSIAEATNAQEKYYLRIADKSGLPAVTSALLRSPSYYAVLGHKSADSAASITAALRHNYIGLDGSELIKHITKTQPDWIYWVCPTGVTSIYMECTIYWSDGSESTWQPFGTTGNTVAVGKMYWIAAGPSQLKVFTQSPPSGAEPDAYITGYRAQIRRTDGLSLIGNHGVTYHVAPPTDWDALYLLFSNGVGGCESVSLRGKFSSKYNTSSEVYSRQRAKGWTAADGDYHQFASSGRSTWEANTGWYSDKDYIHHLRQLPLAHTWLIDLNARKFRRVLVDPGEILISPSDDTLYAIQFNIRAAWQDAAANV